MERFSVAEIAQLVEHNLAKVGVASSSLVFRSKSKFDFSVLRRRYRPISGIFFCFQKVEQESGVPTNVIPGKDQEPHVHVIANVRKDSIAGK